MQDQQQGAAAQAQEKAQEAAGQAKEQATQAAGQAKDQVKTQVDQRSTQAGEQVKSQASDIRTVAEQLREQGKDKPAQLAEQAADRAEKLGSYLTESNADRILGDIEDFARQKPMAVIAGGIALGFAASRFLKASSTDRYRAGTGTNGGTSTGNGGYTRPDVGRDDRITRPANELSTGVGVGATPGVPATGTTPAAPATAHPTTPVGGL